LILGRGLEYEQHKRVDPSWGKVIVVLSFSISYWLIGFYITLISVAITKYPRLGAL
jgi:hypothetical protein